jgi:formylglycine-generating enzyme required for sulfatase activity
MYTYTSKDTSDNRCISLAGVTVNYELMGYRLPTEAEWEYACRAGTKAEYYWGTANVDNYAWYAGNSNSNTSIVAQKLPNAFGLFDMNGNVWEWCNDWYGDYDKNQLMNPVGVNDGSRRVARGGGWSYGIYNLHSYSRDDFYPEYADNAGGFRAVRRP